MGIQKSIPMQRVIAGKVLKTSEITVVTDSQYKTNGEMLVLCRTNENIEIYKNIDDVALKNIDTCKYTPLIINSRPQASLVERTYSWTQNIANN